MNIELISESEWISILDGSRKVQFQFLAFQIFLVNLRNRFKANEISIADCIRELKNFHAKFRHLPLAEDDFAQLATPVKPPANQLLDPQETARRILAGETLMLAGAEKLLAALPPGKWIGGTIPYFMTPEGGCRCTDKIFVTEIPVEFQATLRRYAATELPVIYADAEAGVLSLVILPADSPAHAEFALHAPNYVGFALHPLVGWIAGTDLTVPDQSVPKVFCGGPTPMADGAVVMRLQLPANRVAQVNTINLFQPGTGDPIRFLASGFSATTALINGQKQNLAEYLHRTKADLRLPLVANDYGLMLNVSLKNVDVLNQRVHFYAPVVAGLEYRLAFPVADFVAEFAARVKRAPERVLFSCNCVLNYLHSQLEGRPMAAFVGPVSFGEIAFQLLNQTLVYVEILKVGAPGHGADGGELTTLQLSAAHEELQASERRFRALTEGSPLGIFLTDARGKLLYENPACQKISGVVIDGLGGDWRRNIHPHDLPGLLAALQESERAGRDLNHEFRFVHPGGTICWVQARLVLQRTESGGIAGRVGIFQDITDRKHSEVELERVNQELIQASREAGVAEISSGTLHNVKNVINSINVSAGVIAEQLKKSKAANLARVAALLAEHAADLGTFMTVHPQGKLLPGYLDQLARQMEAGQSAVLAELQQFEKNVQHVKEIVTTQQTYAKLSGASELTKPVELLEDALRIDTSSLARHGIQLEREYATDLPDITVVKHKVLQILVNLIRNAKQSCQAANRPDAKLILRVSRQDGFLHFVVADNGIGIAAENLTHVFEHGFTTKQSGHGFGLHSGILAARELGGEIQAHSDGPGTGATFTLKLPLGRGAPA